jgi:glycerol-3-phosphate acyltransferase PlsX
MRIAVDAMGSDGAPFPEVRGAVDAAAVRKDVELVLVGDETRVHQALDTYPNRSGNISVVHAPEVITMEDSPVMAVRTKKQSSLLVGMRLVKDNTVDGFVSAGNTGAVMVAARTVLGPIKGVARSAICQQLPSLRKPVLLIDLGANVDCTARHLCDFAEMGMLYSERVMDVANPRVGLLNIGEERLKGNELSKTVHRNLQAASYINFIGNVEPKGIFKGDADVVVCDGYIGNMVLKTSEAVGFFLRTRLERELRATLTSKVGALLSLGAFRRLKKSIDPNEQPGAPLLGVNGTVIILHGSCKSRGVTQAIEGACRAVERDLNDHIRRGIEQLRATEEQLDRRN